jgi:hypothetical protein
MACRLHSRFAAAHNQGVEHPNDGFEQQVAGLDQLFGLVQRQIIAEYLCLIALTVRKVCPLATTWTTCAWVSRLPSIAVE